MITKCDPGAYVYFIWDNKITRGKVISIDISKTLVQYNITLLQGEARSIVGVEESLIATTKEELAKLLFPDYTSNWSAAMINPELVDSIEGVIKYDDSGVIITKDQDTYRFYTTRQDGKEGYTLLAIIAV